MSPRTVVDVMMPQVDTQCFVARSEVEQSIFSSIGLKASVSTHRHLSRFLTAVALVSLDANQNSKKPNIC